MAETVVSDPIVASVMARIDSRVRQIMAEQGVPGIALGIVHDQTVAWKGGFGFADIASARAMDAETICGVASITKTFTATAIVQLRDEGKLRLDDPIVRHIPEFKAVPSRFGANEEVTLRRLLTHRAGLVGESPDGHWSNLEFPSMQETLAMLARCEVVIEPDSAFKYCNLAFALLGEVVERVSGRPYRDYVMENILAPLGMTSSGFDIAARRERVATGYMPERYQDVPTVAPDPPTRGYEAAAGLRTCVSDLAKWISLQFRTKADDRGGAQVLKGKSISAMHRVTFVERDWKVGYALTWMGARIGENIYLNHGGSVPGFLSMLAFNKPHKLGVVALSNKQGNIAASAIAFEALEMLMAAAKTEFRAAPPIATPERFKPLIGRYVGMDNFGGVLHIEFRGGKLVLASPTDPFLPPPPPPVPLVATAAPQTFIVSLGRPAGEPLRFELDAQGRATGFILGDNGGRYRKTD